MEQTSFGGSFIFDKTLSSKPVIPENFTEEQKMFAKTAEDFMKNEVLPNNKSIESMEEGVMPALVKKAGEIGLLMGSIPEKLGGLGLGEVSNMMLTEKLAIHGSFSVAFGAHTGIGTLPLLYFGSEALKQKFIPLLATGEKLAAYALTEAGSGSDALGAKTKAELSQDGKYYILNGSKQFITNSGFADLFTVFAKIDGSKFTAFLVEKNTPGLSTGAEEAKMGIKGSSTRSLILENVKVPVENVIGKIGRGQLIAFNILYIGRYKLAAGCIGSAKNSLKVAINYANSRKQFEKFISEFDFLKEKIALMATKTYALESMLYRLVGEIDASMKGTGKDDEGYCSKFIDLIQSYGIECSALKVFGSETLDFVVDEALQILGGYGFCQEYPIEMFYRDSRINRIFEGTNEINRLIIGGDIVRKAKKNRIPLNERYEEIKAKKLTFENCKSVCSLQDISNRLKELVIYLTGEAVSKNPKLLSESQCIVKLFSDMIINLYAIDSLLLRAELLKMQGHRNQELFRLFGKIFIFSAIPVFESAAKEIATSLPEQNEILSVSSSLLKIDWQNSLKEKLEVADFFIKNPEFLNN